MRTTCDRREIDIAIGIFFGSNLENPQSHQGKIIALIARSEPANLQYKLSNNGGQRSVFCNVCPSE